MALSIRTDAVSLASLRRLATAGGRYRDSLARLASGTRILRASDDVSGLVQSELLRAQISGVRQSIENNQFSRNLLMVAESALSQTADLLVDVRADVVSAMSSGGLSDEQRQALQASVDQSLSAISRTANTARFGDKQLFSGLNEIKATNLHDAIESVDINAANFGDRDSLTFKVQLITKGDRGVLRAQVDPTGAVGSAQVVDQTQSFTITGPDGSATVTVSAGGGKDEVAAAVNEARSQTGVLAVTGVGTTFELRTEEFGSAQSITLEIVEGSELAFGAGSSGTPATMNVGNSITSAGIDAVAQINNQVLTAKGNEFTYVGPELDATIRVSENAKVNFPAHAAGEIIESVDISGTAIGNSAEGIAYDGVSSIFVSTGSDYYELDPNNGFQLVPPGNPFTPEDPPGTSLIVAGAEAMAIDGTTIYIGDAASDDVSSVLLQTPPVTLVNGVDNQFQNPTGLALVGGTLFVLSTQDSKVYQVDGLGTLNNGSTALDLNTISAGGVFSGMTTDGTFIYVGEAADVSGGAYQNQKVHVFDTSFNKIKEFTFSAPVSNAMIQDVVVSSATTDGVPGTGGNFYWSDFTYDGENLLILTNDTQGGTRRSIINRIHLGTEDYTFDVVATGSGGFDGLKLQLGERIGVADQAVIALPTLDAGSLGATKTVVEGVVKGGTLSDIQSGGDFDLSGADFENTLLIVDGAISKIATTRARIGSMIALNVNSAISAGEAQDLSLTSSRSKIVDLDYAGEVSRNAASQVLQAAGMRTLRAAGDRASQVLALLRAASPR